MRRIFAVMLFAILVSGPSDAGSKGYDFEFKNMDVMRAVAQIGKLLGKEVVFSGSIAPKPIDISLRDVTAQEALKMILDSNGLAAVESHGMLKVIPGSERAPTSLPTVIIAMNNVLAKELEPNVKSMLSGAAGAGAGIGSVTVNEALNALVVSAPADVVLRIRELVTELDQESPQVFIEAKIVETSTTFSRQLGIEWGPSLDDRSGVPGLSLSAKAANDAFHAGVTTRVGNSVPLNARLTAGESNGDVKIVSSPKITTLNGMPANIESSTTLIVRTLATTTPSSGGASGAPALVGGIERIKSGISLRVTPYIVSRQCVRLVLALSKSDPDNSNKVDGIPGITDNSANTSLIVRTGETASIGGLILKSTSNNSNGVPFLASLPILGLLFGSQEKDKTDKELMIFLTPTIFRKHMDLLPSTAPSVPPEKG